MKKVEAVVRQEKLDKLKKALEAAGFCGLTSYEVKGRGRQGGISLAHRTSRQRVDMLPKTKIELIVRSEDADKAVDIIISAGKTGAIGDGKVFVSSVAEVIRVRTGEHGDPAV